LERLDDRLVLSAVTPAQLAATYGLNAVSFSSGTIKGTGEGQTIAIIDAYNDPTIVSDLAAFDKANGLKDPVVTATPVANAPGSTATPSFSTLSLGTKTDAGWNEEEALDVEVAHAAAPGANIVLVEAASASTTDLIAAVNAAKKIASVSVISMSWGGSEYSGQKAYDSVFTTPAGHTGITFIASAGDSGPGASWPASSPNVVAVGGTTLIQSANGTVTGQKGWSGSGGGTSTVELKPSYQAATNTSRYRSTPDVVLDADPNTGLVIVSGGQSIQVGGTSLSAPLFGGLIAVADQGLAVAGKPSLDGATQTLPDLYKAPTAAFTPVVGASTRVGFGWWSSTVTTPTGLGSPNAPALVASLDGTPAPRATVLTPTGTGTGGTTNSGGSTGSTGTTSGGTTSTGGGTTSTGGGTGPIWVIGGGWGRGRTRWGVFGAGAGWWWESNVLGQYR
jgi:hypothetical protein